MGLLWFLSLFLGFFFAVDASDLYKMAFKEKYMFQGAPKVWKAYIHKFLSRLLSFVTKTKSQALLLKVFHTNAKIFRSMATLPFPIPTVKILSLFQNTKFLKRLYGHIDPQFLKYHTTPFGGDRPTFSGIEKIKRLTGKLQFKHAANVPCSRLKNPVVARKYTWSHDMCRDLYMKINVSYIIVAAVIDFDCSHAFVIFYNGRSDGTKLCGYHSSMVLSYDATKAQTTIQTMCSIFTSVEVFLSVMDRKQLLARSTLLKHGCITYNLVNKFREKALQWNSILVSKYKTFELWIIEFSLFVHHKVFAGPGQSSPEVFRRNSCYHILTFQCYVLRFREKRQIFMSYYWDSYYANETSQPFQKYNSSLHTSYPSCGNELCAYKVLFMPMTRINITLQISKFTGMDKYLCLQGGISIYQEMEEGWKEVLVLCHKSQTSSFYFTGPLLILLYSYKNYGNLEAWVTSNPTNCFSVQIDPCDFTRNCQAFPDPDNPSASYILPACISLMETWSSDAISFEMEKGSGSNQRTVFFRLVSNNTFPCVVIEITKKFTNKMSVKTVDRDVTYCHIGMAYSRRITTASGLEMRIVTSFHRPQHEMFSLQGLFQKAETRIRNMSWLQEETFYKHNTNIHSSQVVTSLKTYANTEMNEFTYMTWDWDSFSLINIEISKMLNTTRTKMWKVCPSTSVTAQTTGTHWTELGKASSLLVGNFTDLTIHTLWDEAAPDRSRNILSWSFGETNISRRNYKLSMQASKVAVPHVTSVIVENITIYFHYLYKTFTPHNRSSFGRLYSLSNNTDILVVTKKNASSWIRGLEICYQTGRILPILNTQSDMDDIVKFVKLSHFFPFVEALFLFLKQRSNKYTVSRSDTIIIN